MVMAYKLNYARQLLNIPAFVILCI